MNTKELVRAKNMDLLVHSYNKEATKMNREGFINKESKETRALRDKYEGLIARFDTDKNTKKQKTGGGYHYDAPLDSIEIIGLNGIKPTIKLRGTK